YSLLHQTPLHFILELADISQYMKIENPRECTSHRVLPFYSDLLNIKENFVTLLQIEIVMGTGC
ncbi:hypothetical protein MEN41_17300, partial [Dolichospermum sp. ST_con]|nr:hypothetical protein [Dolichospermum sp. ST_con]